MGNLVNKILPSEFKRRITVKRPNSVTDDSGGTSNCRIYDKVLYMGEDRTDENAGKGNVRHGGFF
jgi:hypothetical protein